MTIYENLRDAVIETINNSGEKKADIERKSGVSRSAYHRWEKSGTTPNALKATKVINALGYDVNYVENKVHLSAIGSVSAPEKKIIKLQNALIESHNEIISLIKEIESLKKINRRIQDEYSSVATFEIRSAFDEDFQRLDFEVSGNTLDLGYGHEELESLSVEQFLSLYHPDSRKEGERLKKYIKESKLDYNRNEAIRTMKSKTNKWISYEVVSHMRRTSIGYSLEQYYRRLQ